jgi:hypothetical protein
MAAERRTAKNWGARLSMPDEPLSLDEMRTYAAMSTADRTLEMLTVLTDLRDRLQRLEMFVEETVPGYAQHAERTRRRQEQHDEQKALGGANGVPHAM